MPKHGKCEQCGELSDTLIKFRSIFVCISCEDFLVDDEQEYKGSLKTSDDRLESSLYDDYQNDY